MATIQTGYDFGVNERPDRDKLLRAARFARITDVAIADIAASLIGLRSGDSGTTAASTLGPGWMWADRQGSLWVDTDHGQVQLKRAGGGFETVRWGLSINASSGNGPWRPGWEISFDPAENNANQTEGLNLANGESGAGKLWIIDFIEDSPLAHHIGYNAATVDSGSSFPRLVCRGLTHIATQNQNSMNGKFCGHVACGRVDGATNGFQFAFTSPESNAAPPSGSIRYEVWYTVGVSPDSGSSYTGIGLRNYVVGWKYDQAVWGPGTNI